MYVIDLSHWLDDKGAIALPAGPGLDIAEFVCNVVASASDEAGIAEMPPCFKCHSSDVHKGRDDRDRVVWQCQGCKECGVVSNWRRTLWDMTDTYETDD